MINLLIRSNEKRMCCLQAEHEANTTLIVRNTSSNSLAEMETIWQLTISMRVLSQILLSRNDQRIYESHYEVIRHDCRIDFAKNDTETNG